MTQAKEELPALGLHSTKGLLRRGSTSGIGALALCCLALGCAAEDSGPAGGDGDAQGAGPGVVAGTGSTDSGTGAAPSTASGATNAGTGAADTGTGTGGGGAVAGTGAAPGTGGTGGSVEPVDIPGGVSLNGQPQYYKVIRLTHAQWENSVRDVLMLSEITGLSQGFFPDPPDGTFSNNERALYIADELRVDYQRITEELVATVAGDAAALSQLGGVVDSSAFIASIGRRAFRRALSADEQAAYEALWLKGAEFYASGDAAVDGAQVFLEALLQSPHFLFRLELTGTGSRLSGAELATKLSFLLRNTTPSEALLDQAASGALDTNEGLLALATTMLTEAEARTAVSSYHTELYGIDRFATIDKSSREFPEYSQELNEIILQADLLFFNRVFDSDLGLREILQSNVAYVNEDTAVFYGLSATGSELSEVTLDATRPGFLTRIGFLAYNATLVDPDPIHRGVDILHRVLCMELDPPAGEIPPLPDPESGQTNRQRVEAHTGEGSCANCHNTIINPLGFAFENFDAVGQARAQDAGQDVDTTGTFSFNSGDASFADAPELISLMVEGDQAHGCYTARLAEFVLARDVASGEGDVVTAMQQASVTSDASIKELILTMIQDPLFTNAQGGAQ